MIFIFLWWTSLYCLCRKKNSTLLYHKKHAVDYGTATSITSNIRVMPYMSVSRTYRYSVFYSVPCRVFCSLFCYSSVTGNGNGGNDKINGGQGDIKLTGGRGADTFNCGNGSDTITDFNEAEGDKANRDCENVSRG
jgi:hypothetical protein